ncbi:hypothetical protein CgunFtcFv8_027137 [Champsocephalus gunnari]|uniref:Fibronectin type-III domain-containing protein n=1 Tax=Champsocephalus gunnari TaxID=52237 RepID=A0AAN8E649_CHAGU|nr:hypothetical protein CgunFtcFv8_027137 [Champsocephalus gunnari]
MATLSHTWTILTAVTVLTVQLCEGKTCCNLESGAGIDVLLGSSFKIYCTSVMVACRKEFYGQNNAPLPHKVLNSTTIYYDVVNITEKKTYSCKCLSSGCDSCGQDLSTGYPPECPKNISCTYEVKNSDSGDVFCSWDRGRDTFLKNDLTLEMRILSKNHTHGPMLDSFSSKATAQRSASVAVPGSVLMISVWVHAKNALGSAASIHKNYTLSDIKMPSTPVLRQPDCTSQECIITVEQPVMTQHLEIQYRADTQTWTSSPDSVVQIKSVQVASLEPYTLYHFRVRSKFSTGLWSLWSASISNWTEEEAPAKELDVWYAEPASDFRSLTVYWKELSISAAKGKILSYRVRVYSPNSGQNITNVSAEARSYSVPFCAECEVSVWACNSKGSSPPAYITSEYTKVKLRHLDPLQDVHKVADNLSITLSWRKPYAAVRRSVVEWFPKGHTMELRWVGLGRNENHVVITDVKPFECYEGAVYVFYNESSVRRTRFTGVTTLESAPAAVPSVQETVEGKQVRVTWAEIPRGQRGGCLTNYNIYLENQDNQGHRKHYSIQASQRVHVIKDLSSGTYTLCMTASTAKGEGPAGKPITFFMQQESQLSLLLMCAVAAPIVIVLVCLYHSSAVKQRFWVYFQCLMLDIVPDPANSKWAKECIQDKGKMNLQLQLSNSSGAEEEEEPILVDVEELPRPTSLSPETETVTVLYPRTTYIKSFSHDSDSSDLRQTSMDTNSTVDYISSHGAGIMDEEEEEEEEEEEMLGFFPSHNIFIEQLEFGGKLTLNAVKIDCGDFFPNSAF